MLSQSSFLLSYTGEQDVCLHLDLGTGCFAEAQLYVAKQSDVIRTTLMMKSSPPRVGVFNHCDNLQDIGEDPFCSRRLAENVPKPRPQTSPEHARRLPNISLL